MYSRHYYFVKWKEKKEIFLYYSFKRGGLIIYTRYYYFIKWKEKKKIFLYYSFKKGEGGRSYYLFSILLFYKMKRKERNISLFKC